VAAAKKSGHPATPATPADGQQREDGRRSDNTPWSSLNKKAKGPWPSYICGTCNEKGDHFIHQCTVWTAANMQQGMLMTVTKAICQKCLSVRAAHHECHPNSENYLCNYEGCARSHHMSLHDPMQAQQQKENPTCGVMTRDTTTTTGDQDEFAGKVLVDTKEYNCLIAYVEGLKQAALPFACCLFL